ncbi:MAG TPA: sulfite exporter TauE/SafE family protein [Bryobacteraceae bacterium]|nr:sulfite exporter TauE/SafE family protein [Bryobacteraceae bacterium]
MEILAGFVIALAIGITGVGAGSITAPILILFFRQSASDAVTTALVFGTVVKLIATPIYLSRGHVNFRVLKFMAMGGLPAVLLGSYVLTLLDQKAMTNPVLLIVGLTVLATAAATLWRSLAKTIAVRPAPHPKLLPWIVAPIGFEVGFSSAGAGALGTIVLMRYTDLAASDVVGTDLAFGLLLSIFAGGIHASMTGVPWLILGKLLLGGIPAVLIGTQLIHVVSPRKMRLALCVWLIYIGGQLTQRGISGFTTSVKAAQATQAAALPGAATKR